MSNYPLLALVLAFGAVTLIFGETIIAALAAYFSYHKDQHVLGKIPRAEHPSIILCSLWKRNNLDYLVVFAVSFLSATLLPLGSEAVLLYYANGETASVINLWACASLANTLGGLTNWFLGVFLMRYEDKKWFPIKAPIRHKAQRYFNRYGILSLLFTWLPVVGDAIVLAAGVFRTPLRYLVLLVFIGKAARYALVLWGQSLLSNG